MFYIFNILVLTRHKKHSTVVIEGIIETCSDGYDIKGDYAFWSS